MATEDQPPTYDDIRSFEETDAQRAARHRAYERRSLAREYSATMMMRGHGVAPSVEELETIMQRSRQAADMFLKMFPPEDD